MSGDINTRATAALRALGIDFLKGWSLVDDSGARAVVVELGPRWREDEFWKPQNEQAIGEGLAAFRPGYGLTALTGWLVDLSDPVTAASLIVLVREAWGDDVYGTESDPTEGRRLAMWLPGDLWVYGDTWADLYVAALVAKAREVAP